MYNNEISYHEKWNTEENKGYRNKVMREYGSLCHVMSDCPPAWAKEVYQLLQGIDEDYGIVRRFGIHGIDDWVEEHPEDKEKAEEYKRFNKEENPQVTLSQIKEKFGELTVYITAEEDVRKDIEERIRKTEIALSKKGAYYTFDQLWEWSLTRYEDGEEDKSYPYRKYIKGDK